MDRSNQRQPVGKFIAAALYLIKVHFLQALGDRTASAVADDAAVHFADRRHLGGGAGEEGLIGDIHLVAGDALFPDRNPEVGGETDDGVTGDAFQRRRRSGYGSNRRGR